jgi:hypothetical protein
MKEITIKSNVHKEIFNATEFCPTLQLRGGKMI